MATSTYSSPGTEPDRIQVWDLPLRLFHWLLVASVTLAYLSSQESGPVAAWHMAAGWAAAVLILFRVAGGSWGENIRAGRTLCTRQLPPGIFANWRTRRGRPSMPTKNPDRLVESGAR